MIDKHTPSIDKDHLIVQLEKDISERKSIAIYWQNKYEERLSEIYQLKKETSLYEDALGSLEAKIIQLEKDKQTSDGQAHEAIGRLEELKKLSMCSSCGTTFSENDAVCFDCRAEMGYMMPHQILEALGRIEELKKLSTCGCGDRFTEDDLGMCGNCRAAKDNDTDRFNMINQSGW